MTKKEATARVWLTGDAHTGYHVMIATGPLPDAASRIPVETAKTGHALVRALRAALLPLDL